MQNNIFNKRLTFNCKENNAFLISELETTGANFLKGGAGDKNLVCQLTDPGNWLEAAVTMKVTAIGSNKVISCNTNTDDADQSTFECPDTPAANDNLVFDAVLLNSKEVKIPFIYKGTDTARFRCEVTVEDTTSAVMIYAEALRKYFIY